MAREPMTFSQAVEIVHRARKVLDDPRTPEDMRLRLRAALDQVDAAVEGIRELGDVARGHQDG